jgi:hypothetical protein
VARFRREPKLYLLRFEDYPGFEVTMKGLSIEGFLELAKTAGALQGSDMSAMKPEALTVALDSVEGLFSRFAGLLVSWNLDDEETGDPVPADVAGVRSQGMDFILEIVMAWMDAIAAVDPTSRTAANGSGTFPEVSLPMEPLSPSHLS